MRPSLLKRLRATVTSLLCFAAPSLGFGQVTDVAPNPGAAIHAIGVALGVNDVHMQDQYLTPFIYRGQNFSARVTYALSIGNQRHMIEGTFSTGGLASDAQAREMTHYAGSFSYAYLHALHAWEMGGVPARIFIGAVISSFAMETDIFTPNSINWYVRVEDGYYWSHALSLRMAAEYGRPESDILTIHAEIPLVSIVSRPEAAHYQSQRNLEVNENFLNAATKGSLAFPWDSFALRASVDYQHTIGEHCAVRGTYDFIFAASDRPLHMDVYMNRLLVGLEVLF